MKFYPQTNSALQLYKQLLTPAGVRELLLDEEKVVVEEEQLKDAHSQMGEEMRLIALVVENNRKSRITSSL